MQTPTFNFLCELPAVVLLLICRGFLDNTPGRNEIAWYENIPKSFASNTAGNGSSVKPNTFSCSSLLICQKCVITLYFKSALCLLALLHLELEREKLLRKFNHA